MSNKVAIVTGANSGIGKETAQALAEDGTTVVLMCRNMEKGLGAQQDIIDATGNEKIELIECDLASLDSIKKAAQTFLAKHDTLHILVNNAGLVRRKHSTTVDGFETQFGVNHLGPFVLTNLLLDTLRKSAPARIVTVSSGAHRMGRLDFNDLNYEKRRYSSMRVYAASKLANIMFTYELARRLEGTGVTATVLHPGVVNTNLGDGEMPRLFKLSKPFMISPARGAETSIYLARSPEVEGVTGEYFEKKKSVRSVRHSYDREMQKKLWEVSAAMTGVGA